MRRGTEAAIDKNAHSAVNWNDETSQNRTFACTIVYILIRVSLVGVFITASLRERKSVPIEDDRGFSTCRL